jgi:hypothetical protein
VILNAFGGSFPWNGGSFPWNDGVDLASRGLRQVAMVVWLVDVSLFMPDWDWSRRLGHAALDWSCRLGLVAGLAMPHVRVASSCPPDVKMVNMKMDQLPFDTSFSPLLLSKSCLIGLVQHRVGRCNL